MLDYNYIDKYNTVEHEGYLYSIVPQSLGVVLIPIIGREAFDLLTDNELHYCCGMGNKRTTRD